MFVAAQFLLSSFQMFEDEDSFPATCAFAQLIRAIFSIRTNGNIGFARIHGFARIARDRVGIRALLLGRKERSPHSCSVCPAFVMRCTEWLSGLGGGPRGCSAGTIGE